jgi:predicted ATPase
MFLRSIAIKNYQSLESVEIDGLSHFNVLIGRNNSGKSSVFSALLLLSGVVRNAVTGEPERVLTFRDSSRRFEITLEFLTRDEDRKELMDLLLGEEVVRKDEAVLSTSFARRLRFDFRSSPSNPSRLHLRETKIWTADNQWALIQKMNDKEEGMNNPVSRMVSLRTAAQKWPGGPFTRDRLDLTSFSEAVDARITYSNPDGDVIINDNVSSWPQKQLVQYLSNAYFFSPFRHGQPRQIVQQAVALSHSGANLAQVLHTLLTNDWMAFQAVQSFIEAAIPNVGMLQTPLTGTQTEVTFRHRIANYHIRLDEMGGGIEQLLMIATVLLTTSERSALFIEEPESHLHAGAQRFLIEKLYSKKRQVFLATHSPTFINLHRETSLYQVNYGNERTTIARIQDAAGLGTVLEDIGARNSDVLLSDAVLFVEGPGDKGAMNRWSETLGMSFAERNITILPMGGGEHAERGAPLRSDVLQGISSKAPVPHKFLLDRDERSQDELDSLTKRLGDRVMILKARELENYFLIPRALRQALQMKCKDDSSLLDKIQQVSDQDVQRLITAEADKLYGIVLLKRIRAELKGLRGGIFPREVMAELVPSATSPDLPRMIIERIRQAVGNHINSLEIEEVAKKQSAQLETEWAVSDERIRIAPGGTTSLPRCLLILERSTRSRRTRNALLALCK